MNVSNQNTVHNRKTHEADVKETVKSSLSELQSHSQLAKEELQDSKLVKLSEMSEEKRAKLREIEVNLLTTHALCMARNSVRYLITLLFTAQSDEVSG